MANANDQFYNDFINGTDVQNSSPLTSLFINPEDVTDIDLLGLQNASLEDFLGPFRATEDFRNIRTPSSVLFHTYGQSSPKTSPQSINQTASSATTTLTFNSQSTFEHLEMVEQPYQSSKLRYRADYTREKRRLGALGNKNKISKHRGPAIRIPQRFLNSNNEYYIRVSLVTIKYNKTNLHYFHPYELEDPKNEDYNDRQNNSVWFPIEANDSIKNFPSLRIVKKKAFHVQTFDQLRIFDSHNEVLQNTIVPQHSVKKEIDIIKEYNLNKSQLAFTLGRKTSTDGQSSTLVYPNTTIFSDEMEEKDERQSDTETDVESSSEKSPSSSSDHRIYKYAPRSGMAGRNNEILIFLKKRLNSRKYGDLQITFECDTSRGHWTQPVINLDMKDRMISFQTPILPYAITNPMVVDIVLRQDDRIFGILKYSYLPGR